MLTIHQKMIIKNRLKIIIYLVITIIGMSLLAASLSELHFKPGLPIPSSVTSQSSKDPVIQSTNPVVSSRSTYQILLFAILLLLLIVLVLSLIRKLEFTKIIKVVGGFLVVLFLFIILNQLKSPSPSPSTGDSQGITILSSPSFDLAPIGDPPKIIAWIVITVLAIGGALIIFLLLFRIQQGPKKEDSLADEVGSALLEIESGADLRNVIIRCYLNMLEIVQYEQGIERFNSVTPREFEHTLVSKGIPILPIHQLTSLFERVRYGSKPTDINDEKEAIECLSSIQFACKLPTLGIR